MYNYKFNCAYRIFVFQQRMPWTVQKVVPCPDSSLGGPRKCLDAVIITGQRLTLQVAGHKYIYIVIDYM